MSEGQKPEQATISEPEADKGKYQRGEKEKPADDEEARKLKMGKGVVPEKKEEAEAVKLKPFEKQVNKIQINCSLHGEAKKLF